VLTVALAGAGDALGDADEQHRGDHRDDEAEHVELEDVPGAQQVGDGAADQRPDQAEQQRGEDAQVPLAGLISRPARR
jgi:hypothetical protein